MPKGGASNRAQAGVVGKKVETLVERSALFFRTFCQGVFISGLPRFQEGFQSYVAMFRRKR